MHGNFIAEWTEVQAPTPEISHEYWTLYFDGSVMGPGVGAGVILVSPEGGKFQYAVRLHFPASNNISEYEALISGLRIAIEIGATRLYVYGDSKLVIDQVMKNSNCESPLMDAYCQEVRTHTSHGSKTPMRTLLQRWPPSASRRLVAFSLTT